MEQNGQVGNIISEEFFRWSDLGRLFNCQGQGGYLLGENFGMDLDLYLLVAFISPTFYICTNFPFFGYIHIWI